MFKLVCLLNSKYTSKLLKKKKQEKTKDLEINGKK